MFKDDPWKLSLSLSLILSDEAEGKGCSMYVLWSREPKKWLKEEWSKVQRRWLKVLWSNAPRKCLEVVQLEDNVLPYK